MKLTRRTIIYIFFSILFLVIVINFFRTLQGQGVVLTLPAEEQIFLDVADSPEERMFGLVFRETLPQNQGMIFLFEQGEPVRLWTRGYRFQVDLIWLDGDFKIVGYGEDLAACHEDTCPTYSPDQESARYGIQIAAGQIQRHGLIIGDQLNLGQLEH